MPYSHTKRQARGEHQPKTGQNQIGTTAVHIRDDTLTAGRLVEQCLWEAQGENLSEAEVKAAAGGNLLTFMVSELNALLIERLTISRKEEF